MTLKLDKTVIVTGHYGSGKTNLAINLAMMLKRKGEAVALCDLDVVNPYFRTADFKDMAAKGGIELFASDYANSNLDIPSLSGGMEAALGTDKTVIIDVGGDDAGAFALGRYAKRIEETPYTMLYIVNAYRYLTREPEESAELLYQIEAASRLKATHIVNCSSLGTETTAEDIKKSLDYAEKVAKLTGRPLLFTAVDERLTNELKDLRDMLPVKIYVKVPWQA